jgi:hypothetical protein
MRATLQSDMFLYEQLGQNVDIRGVIRYVHPLLLFAVWGDVTNTLALVTQMARRRDSLVTRLLPIPARVYPVWPM